MKNLSIQKEFGWCNVHTLANVFRDKSFLEFLSNNEYKSGDVDSMNNMLEIAGYSDFAMFPIIGVAQNHPPIPQEYFTQIILDGDEIAEYSNGCEFTFIPYFLTVQIKAPHYHSVAILKFKDVYLYIDPYLEDIKMIKTPNEAYGHFNNCLGIERLIRKSSKGKDFLMLNGSKLGFSEMF